MTQSVANQTPIIDRAGRRHTDPPGLWIAVACGSFTLHLLGFWLMRSYAFSHLLYEDSSNPVPIEFITISPPKAKPVAPNSLSTPQKPTSAPGTKPITQQNSPATSTPVVEDRETIAVTDDDTDMNAIAQPPLKTQTVEPSIQLPSELEPVLPENKQPEPTPSPVITPEEIPPEPTPTPKAAEEIPPEPTPQPDIADNHNVDTQNQENQALVPPDNTTDSTDTESLQHLLPQSDEQQLTPSEATGLPTNILKPDGDVVVKKGQSLKDLAQPIEPNQSPPLNEPKGFGVGIASWTPETSLIRKEIIDNPPQLIGDSREKELNLPSLSQELENQPLEFLATLVINKEGELIMIIIDPEIPEPKASQYQKYADELFKGQKFIPASKNNGTKPENSQLPVRIRIQPKNQNNQSQ
ncbi:MAG: hypothetical protein SAK29_09865 [Scytonema sp. PMC 1069.18]|nr:hypothetical protein [Scytonema sp. PMC 1069.18]MEC4883425.1 hypothetical protein [Scytonema sp. PMC 1070.18]